MEIYLVIPILFGQTKHSELLIYQRDSQWRDSSGKTDFKMPNRALAKNAFILLSIDMYVYLSIDISQQWEIICICICICPTSTATGRSCKVTDHSNILQVIIRATASCKSVVLIAVFWGHLCKVMLCKERRTIVSL